MTLNTDLMDAYNAPTYFRDKFDSTKAGYRRQWDRNDKTRDLYSRPRPLLWVNQTKINAAGQWSGSNTYMSATDYLTIHHSKFDVVSICNRNGTDMLAEASDIRAKLAQTHDMLQTLRYTDPITNKKNRVFCLPYHRNDSCEGTTNNMWDFCNSYQSDGYRSWARSSSGYYGPWSYDPNYRRCWDSTSSYLQDYWANSARALILASNADGIFGDNHFHATGSDWNVEHEYWRDRKEVLKTLTGFSQGYNAMDQALLNKMGANNVLIIGNGMPTRMWGDITGMNPPPYSIRHFSMMEDWRNDNFNRQTMGHAALDTEDWAASTENGMCMDSAAQDRGGFPYYRWRLHVSLLHDGVFGVDINAMLYVDWRNYIAQLRTKRIGYPIEDRVLVSGSGNAGLFKREYTHGIVIANTSTTTRSISIPSNTYTDLDGNTIAGGTYNLGTNGSYLWLKKTVTPPPPPDNKPAAPSNLQISNVRKNLSSEVLLDLIWSDNSTNESGFYINGKVNVGGTYTQLFSEPANTTGKTINLGAIVTPATYFYKVDAWNSYGFNTSNEASLYIDPATIPVPSAPQQPSNLRFATTPMEIWSTGKYVVNLQWDNAPVGATGIKIYFRIVPADGSDPDDWGAAFKDKPTLITTQYAVDIGTAPTFGIYEWAVTWTNQYGESLKSNSVYIQIYQGGGTVVDKPIPSTLPQQPVELTNGANPYGTYITNPIVVTKTDDVNGVPTQIEAIHLPIHWTNPEPINATGIDIQMKLSGIPANHWAYKWENTWYSVKLRDFTTDNYLIYWTEFFNEVFDVPREPVAPENPGLKGQEPRCNVSFRVRLSNSTGFSPFSNEFTFIDINPDQLYGTIPPPPDPPDPLATPTEVGTDNPYKTIGGDIIIPIYWTNNAPTATGFRIYWSTDNINYSILYTSYNSTNTSMNLNISGLLGRGYEPLNTFYYFKIQAVGNNNTLSELSSAEAVFVSSNIEQPQPPTEPDPTGELVEYFISEDSLIVGTPRLEPVIAVCNGDFVITLPPSYLVLNYVPVNSGNITITRDNSLELDYAAQSSGNFFFDEELIRDLDHVCSTAGNLTISSSTDITLQSNVIAECSGTCEVTNRTESTFSGTALISSTGSIRFADYLQAGYVAHSTGNVILKCNSTLDLNYKASTTGNCRVRYEFKNMQWTVTSTSFVTFTLSIEDND